MPAPSASATRSARAEWGNDIVGTDSGSASNAERIPLVPRIFLQRHLRQELPGALVDLAGAAVIVVGVSRNHPQFDRKRLLRQLVAGGADALQRKERVIGADGDENRDLSA